MSLLEDARQLTDAEIMAALPEWPTKAGYFEENQYGNLEHVTFNNKRILQIPDSQNLPNGVNEETQVHLRTVMHLIIGGSFFNDLK